MDTKAVEKVLGKKFVEGPSLQEQCTPQQWAEICFISALETAVLTEKGKPDKKLSDKEIERRVKEEWDELLKKHNGDHHKALNEM